MKKVGHKIKIRSQVSNCATYKTRLQVCHPGSQISFSFWYKIVSSHHILNNFKYLNRVLIFKNIKIKKVLSKSGNTQLAWKLLELSSIELLSVTDVDGFTPCQLADSKHTDSCDRGNGNKGKLEKFFLIFFVGLRGPTCFFTDSR